MRFSFFAFVTIVVVGVAPGASAHSEYQAYVQTVSGRTVNCAMCHTHSDGPVGAGPGQIGSLTSTEMGRLNQSRAAFEPGLRIDSPILNDFGDLLVAELGKKKILELRSRPEQLIDELGMESDLDEDGIPDAREYADGTHPLSPHDGDPWLLFRHNFSESIFHLFMIGIATLITLYGLINVLKGFAVEAEQRSS